jgi:hypothetical protein
MAQETEMVPIMQIIMIVITRGGDGDDDDDDDNNNNNNNNNTYTSESANVEAQKSLILKTALYAPLTIRAE